MKNDFCVCCFALCGLIYLLRLHLDSQYIAQDPEFDAVESNMYTVQIHTCMGDVCIFVAVVLLVFLFIITIIRFFFRIQRRFAWTTAQFAD